MAASLAHILKGSCTRLLAAKFTLRTSGKVIKKFGSDLKGDGNTAFYNPPLSLKVRDLKTNAKE
jgi:hypothetical protein